MHRLHRLLPLLLLALCLIAPRAHAFGWPGDNDNMFPSAAAAKPSIDFDGHGFLIHGRRVFIASGDLHYSRVPRALWRDRLLRIRRAGYNTVQTYTFWNFHEYKEGQFDFSGDRDFNAYLKLIHSLGMYAIVRVGPYVNAEWDSGGWPVWLRFKPGLVVRDNNRSYLYYLDRWLTHLMPIVAANQINRGGSVIMVQLENEDSRGAGTDVPNPYFKHLKDKCVALGLQVPYFFSGLNHSDNPAGDTPFDISKRTSPWYSTEFWTGWIRFYGADPDRTAKRIRATWNVLANGGAGYTHYTIAGGSDFETWGCNEQAASYDFGAPIGQAGDLRPMYYGFKRAALFATSFPDILANADNATAKFQNVATATGVSTAARSGPAGTLVFLKNDTDKPVKTQIKDSGGKALPSAGPLTLDTNEIMPVVENAALAPGVQIAVAATHILGTVSQGHTTTLVLYGAPGDPGEVVFAPAKGQSFALNTQKNVEPLLRTTGERIAYAVTFPAQGLKLSEFKVGEQTQTVRIVAMSTDMADHTYFIDMPEGNRDIICGPDYVGEVRNQGGHLIFDTEQATADTGKPLPAFLIAASGPAQSLVQTTASHRAQAKSRIPVLTEWHIASGDAEAQPGYTNTGWKVSKAPLAMGADGDHSAYAWYRTTIHAPRDGTYTLNFSDVGDWVTVFIDGVRAASSPVQQRFQDPVTASLKVPLKAGDNSVAMLTAHYGREKLHAYIGPMNTIDAKGISGPVTLSAAGGGSVTLTQWRYKADPRGEAAAAEFADPKLSTDGNGWQDARVGQDLFGAKPGFVWLRTTLADLPGKNRHVHFGAVDDNATVYLNGKRLLHSSSYNTPFDVPLDGAWNPGGPNILTVLDENTNGTGGLTQDVVYASDPFDSGTTLEGWKMRGGVTLPSAADWKPYDGKAAPGAPAFYEAHFVLPPPGVVGPHPVFRVSPVGLSRGFVWLNGHNIGRYPERSPVDGFYLPECWLNPGRNTVVIFDEEGQAAGGVKMVEETIASRVGSELTPMPSSPPAH